MNLRSCVVEVKVVFDTKKLFLIGTVFILIDFLGRYRVFFLKGYLMLRLDNYVRY